MSQTFGVTFFAKKEDLSQKAQSLYLKGLIKNNYTLFLDKNETNDQVIERFTTNEEDALLIDSYGPSLLKDNIGTTTPPSWMQLSIELNKGNFTNIRPYNFLKNWYFPFVVMTWQMLNKKLAFGATINNFEYADTRENDPTSFISENWLLFLHSQKEMEIFNIHKYDKIISIPDGIIVVNEEFKPATHLNCEEIFSFATSYKSKEELNYFQTTILHLDIRLKHSLKELIEKKKIINGQATVIWPDPKTEHNPRNEGTVLVLIQATYDILTPKSIETEIRISFDKKKNTFAQDEHQLIGTIYNAIMRKGAL